MEANTPSSQITTSSEEQNTHPKVLLIEADAIFFFFG